VAVEPWDVERFGRDRGLVEAHCRGDSDAFTLIVTEHYRALLALAQRRLGTRVEAEDAVQEALEKAFRALPRFKGEYRLGAWLSTIVVNVCADHGARRVVEQRVPLQLKARPQAVPDISEGVSDPAVVHAVQEAIAALQPTRRAAFLLYEAFGFSYAQVAEQLGITRDNARARVHRAKADLRKALADTRSTLAGLVIVRLGAGRLARWAGGSLQGKGGRARASAPAPGGEPFPGGVTPSPPSLTVAAGQVASSPIAQVAASVASAAPRTNPMIWLAGLATAAASAFSGPAAAAMPIAAAALPVAAAVATATVAAPPLDSAASTSAPTGSSGPARPATLVADAPAWVAAAAAGDGDPPAPTIGSGAVGAHTPCPWSTDGSVPSAGPISGAVVGMLSTPTLTLDSTSSPELAVTTNLYAGSGASDASILVSVDARACLQSPQILTVDVVGPGGAVQLRASLLRTLSDAPDTRYVFRGVVADSAAGESWGLPDRFVALLDVNPSASTVSLSVAFLGTPLSLPSSSSPSTTTTTPPSPSTTTTTTTTTTPGSTPPSTTTSTTTPAWSFTPPSTAP